MAFLTSSTFFGGTLAVDESLTLVSLLLGLEDVCIELDSSSPDSSELEVPEELSIADAFATGFDTIAIAFLSAATTGAITGAGWLTGAVDGLVTVACLVDG